MIMKKLLFVLLFMMFIPVVNAEYIDYFYVGDWAYNDDYVRISDYWYTNNPGSANVYYYDGEEMVCSEENVLLSKYGMYTVNCDKGDLWEFVEADYDNSNFIFKKVVLDEGVTVHRLNMGSNEFFYEVLKKGDIVLFYNLWGISISYPYEDYNYLDQNAFPYAQTPSDFTHPRIVVGYEAPDWENEIEGSEDAYILADYSFGNSYTDTFVFIPYKEPEFSIRCDKEILKKGEETDCYIEMETNAKLENIGFHLTSKVLDIKESTNISEKYDMEEGEDNYYHFNLKDIIDGDVFDSFLDYAEAVFEGEPFKEPLLKVRVVAKEDIQNSEVLGASDIVYNVAFVEGNSEVETTFVNNNKPVENPKTASNVIIAIVIAIVTLEVLVYLRNKKKTYDV